MMQCERLFIILTGIFAATLVADAMLIHASDNRIEVANSRKESYDRHIQEAIRVIEQGVDDPSARDSVVAAIGLLGHCRAIDGVEVLLKEVSYPNRVGLIEGGAGAMRPIVESCPAVVSLVNIGLPAVKPVLNYLYAGDIDHFERAAAIEVLVVLEDRYKIVAYLRSIAESSDDLEFKQFVLHHVIGAIGDRMKEMPSKRKPSIGYDEAVERYLASPSDNG